MEAKSREKELRFTKIRDKYAQSMRPVNQQKVRLLFSVQETENGTPHSTLFTPLNFVKVVEIT